MLDFDAIIFFYSCFGSNMFVYDIVISWDKRTCFRSKKMLISGFGRGCLWLVNSWVILGIVFYFHRKNIVLAPRFEPISGHFFTHNSSLCMINQ